jgi:hypothetical protein
MNEQQMDADDAVANTLVLAIAERYYPAFRELQQRFAKEA